MSKKNEIEEQINEVFSKDDSQKNLVKVNPLATVNQGFDGPR